jgi:hypothetical protein
MVLICYGVTTPEKWYRLFVHYRWFYKYILNHRQGKSKFTTVVPWDEWGPQNSVLLLGENHQWKGCVMNRLFILFQNPNNPIIDQINYLINRTRIPF